MKKIIIFVALFFPILVFAQSELPSDKVYQARVIEIIEEQTLYPGSKNPFTQQNLRLLGLEGKIKNKEIEFFGISDIEVISNQKYKVGDKVLLAASQSFEGEVSYYVVDYVRTGPIKWLMIIFFLSLIIVGRTKGLRSILSLILTFAVILKFIIPQILSGANPLLVTLIGSFFILLIIIYLTEGFSARSHLSVISIFFSLLITIFLSSLFVNLAKLTGGGSEDVLFLFDLGDVSINLRGLLLSGIIIGALGVLDDVVISQIVSVEQIVKTNPNQSTKEIFHKAYEIGISHISSMTNTLFLAYTGASLPLLILLLTGESAFSSFTQAINTELISTEIVRTLTGSIGLILSVPISTSIAVWWFGRKKQLH